MEHQDTKQIGSTDFKQNLSHAQRKELMGLLKRMLPPVPSRGIIDIRFSFWFVKRWYIVFIFGEDIRNSFQALDKGDVDKGIVVVAKIFTYLFTTVLILSLIFITMYLLKSIAGIDIFPDKHLTDVIKGLTN
ncbi:MAG: hypothetical protein JXR56_09130 [Candidatus Cloacimonetes bacterium]|nr:hypothetical protein [Candidatus Cloacimonadota bacterium]